MENNPLTGLLGLLMLLQLAVVLMILLGGLYALYCLNRAASGLDRLASAVESWVVQTAKTQAQIAAQQQPLPPVSNADWLQPIELPHTAVASNSSSEVAAEPIPLNPSSAPSNSEGEVRRD